MKKNISNIFGTTGLSIIVLSAIALLYRGKFLCINTVFEVLAVNILLHLGLFIIHKFEFKYRIMEIFIENVFVIIIVVFWGEILGWFSSVPIWILIIMGIVIYLISLLLNLLQLRQDAKEINELLQIHNRKNSVDKNKHI
ncbi:MAG: hypothetical protein HDT42_04035 [Ruminococcaceae bacterium]|nr:hypothetical protein [Oscillospiraceae bacterium]